MKRLRSRLLWLGVNVCRILLSATFLFSGIVKLIDPRGTQYKIEDYATAFDIRSWLPLFTPLCLSIGLGFVEFMLGINQLFGIRRKTTSSLTMAFMVIVAPLTLYLAIANPTMDCGCFGDALVLTNWQTFWKNVVLLLMAGVVLWCSRYMTRFITERNQWTVSMFSIVFALVIAVYNVYRLPIIDFRPYHVGVDLPKSIEAELNGTDPEAKYLDFSIQTLDGEDITMDWLNKKGYKFMLIAPFLETADDGAMDRLNNLYEYSEKYGYPFLCLTSSVTESIDRWKDLTGAEYPFAWTDGIVLKTMIRSNPGLILLKDGVIINKWPNTDLPTYEELKAPLDKMEMGKSQTQSIMRRTVRLFLWFIIPLLLVTFLDRLWVGSKYYKRYRIRHTNKQLKEKSNEKEDCCR